MSLVLIQGKHCQGCSSILQLYYAPIPWCASICCLILLFTLLILSYTYKMLISGPELVLTSYEVSHLIHFLPSCLSPCFSPLTWNCWLYFQRLPPSLLPGEGLLILKNYQLLPWKPSLKWVQTHSILLFWISARITFRSTRSTLTFITDSFLNSYKHHLLLSCTSAVVK